MKADPKFISHAVRETMAAIMHKSFGIKSEVLLQQGPKG